MISRKAILPSAEEMAVNTRAVAKELWMIDEWEMKRNFKATSKVFGGVIELALLMLPPNDNDEDCTK